MACGTRKTLVALWAVEQLKPKTVLVLVPSLTLLQQTLDEWSRQNIWAKDFTYLCVCSDPTVVSRDEYDPVQLEAMDLEFRVDTDPDEVRRFIDQDTSNIKVIFSTYHSSPIVSEGVHGLAPLDVAIFDEAHKTTGPRGGTFAHALLQESIAIRKRLFFTATPRHYDIRHRTREGDFKIQSMDDPAIYGPRAHTLTFGSAARQEIICNYKVAISIVDGQEVNDFALKHGITLVQGDLIGAKWVANQLAVERAIEKTSARHVISFHSTVSSAKEFATDTSRGIKQFIPEFHIFHVNGSQHSSERKKLIRDFREAKCSVITNARCLTEGIDVPAVDMVAFVDPRHSKIDIAQATGRAMRKPRGSDKTLGYIVVPLFLELGDEESVEQALERSDFSDVADVLNALQEQDEDLITIVRELQEAKGRGEVFNPRRLAEKLEVLGPTIDLSQLRSNIYAKIVDGIGVSWDEWYGRLKAYKDREGHCRVPPDQMEDTLKLGLWVTRQRRFRDVMPAERRHRLDAIGFEWDPVESAWEKHYSALESFNKREGHTIVPHFHVEGGLKLGEWVIRQRRSKDVMPLKHRQRLDAIGFVWDAPVAAWEEGFAALTKFMRREGHCRVPSRHIEGTFNLGGWVQLQRTNRERMPIERRERLDAIGFVWDGRDAAWEEGFAKLEIFKMREGHCRVPTQHVEDQFNLGRWALNQYKFRNTIPIERRERLNTLGFDLGEDKRKRLRDSSWEEGLAALTKFKEREGHCRVPAAHMEGMFKLGNWIQRQRQNSDILPAEQRRRLDELQFEWDPIEAEWECGFFALQSFKTREGHCGVPTNHIEGIFPLGKWAARQRKNRDTMPPDRNEKLSTVGFLWEPFGWAWETGYAAFKRFVSREGHCRVPEGYVDERGFPLGSWVSAQRRKKEALSADRCQRLEAFAFIWAPLESAWEEGFTVLKKFKAREGHCRVPQGHVENHFNLGAWVSSQRQKKATMAIDRRQRLDSLGFVWNPFNVLWEEGFAALIRFKGREGHCRVPQGHVEGTFKLGAWVSSQRNKEGNLAAERKRRLDEIGFVWRSKKEAADVDATGEK
jgi:superfamily II DNA or RNA helicase